MPQVPMISGNSVGTAARRPNYETPLDVSQTQRQAANALNLTADAVDRIDERVAQDDALRAQAAITQEYAAFNAKERTAAQGRNAEGHVDRVNEWWDKTSSEYAQALNPRAARMVGQQLMRARTASVVDASVYQETQLNRSHLEAFDLSRKAMIGQAIANATDPTAMSVPGGAAQAARLTLNDMRENAENFAKAQGKGPEWVQAQMLAASTDVHVEVIKNLMDGDPLAAAKYFNEHKSQIDPRIYDTVEKGVRKASAANDASKFVDLVWTASGPKGYNDPVAVDKMAKDIRTAFPNDADRRKMALSDLNERVAEHNKAQAEFTAGNKNSALAVYQKTKSLGAVEKSLEYLALAPQDQLQVSNYITGLQASALARQEAALNRDEAAIRRQMAQQMRDYAPAFNALSDPEVLAGMSRQQVAALELQLGPQYTQHLLQRFDSITKSDAKLAEAKVDRDSMDAVLTSLNINPFAKKGEQGVLAGETRRRMELAVDAAQQAAKKVLTREEKEQIMREEAARVVSLPGMLWGTNEVPVATLTPEEVAKVVIPGAGTPAGKALDAALARAYRESGGKKIFEPTDENRRRLYLELSPQEGGLGSRTAGYIPPAK